MYYFTTDPSPVGELMIASEGEYLVGLWIAKQKYYGNTLPEQAVRNDDISVFSVIKNWLEQYFAGNNPSIAHVPLAPIGNEFRQGVWEILRSIPYGEVTSYGSIAKKLAIQTGKSCISAQAVGGAVGHNPISIIIPCHRVVGANGSLTGYAGGIDTKIKLLQLEGVNMSTLCIPKKGTAL